MTTLERFEAKFKNDPATGCWIWQAAKNEKGYGAFGVPQDDGTQKIVTAHRYAYETYVGPIPEGMCVLHKCDTPSCVCPAHLWIGTHQENMADKVAKGRQARGETAGMAKLTEADVIAIRVLWDSGELTQREIADMFEISQPAVSQIVNATRWAHLAA